MSLQLTVRTTYSNTYSNNSRVHYGIFSWEGISGGPKSPFLPSHFKCGLNIAELLKECFRYSHTRGSYSQQGNLSHERLAELVQPLRLFFASRTLAVKLSLFHIHHFANSPVQGSGKEQFLSLIVERTFLKIALERLFRN